MATPHVFFLAIRLPRLAITAEGGRCPPHQPGRHAYDGRCAWSRAERLCVFFESSISSLSAIVCAAFSHRA